MYEQTHTNTPGMYIYTFALIMTDDLQGIYTLTSYLSTIVVIPQGQCSLQNVS